MVKPFSSMPGPRGLPFLGSALAYSKLGKHSFEKFYLAKQHNYKKYGQIYRERLGPGVVIVQLFDPDDVARVLRADGRLPQRPAIPITIVANKRDGLSLGLGSLNGKSWYNLRGPVQKLLMHPRAAEDYLPAQNAVADDLLKLLQQSLDDNHELPDFLQTMSRYAMEAFGSVCFDTRLGCLEQNLARDSLASLMLSSTSQVLQAVQKTSFAFPWYAVFRTKLYLQYINGKKTCESIASKYIKFHGESVGDSDKLCPNFVTRLAAKENLSKDQVLGLTSDLFMAGIDSTANTLSFLLYNLAKNSTVQSKLRSELNKILPKGAAVKASDIEQMKYLKACLKESFRLNFPIEGGTTRILHKQLVLGGYRVPSGTLIALNNQTMCLQSEYFKEPEKFRPERWLKDEGTGDTPPSFVMLPFGHGVRMCIGRRFAEQEVYLAIIKIIQNLEVAYGYEDLHMINRVFTTPDGPVNITFNKVKDNSPCIL